MAPVFFTDRDLGKQFPTILRDAGLNVERHADHFAQDCPDPDWLRDIGAQDWIAITHDGRIRYKPNERAAVIQHHVALLVVIGHAPYAELAHSFVATRAQILNFIDRKRAPPSPCEAAASQAIGQYQLVGSRLWGSTLRVVGSRVRTSTSQA